MEMNEKVLLARKRLNKTQGVVALEAEMDRGAVVLMERYGWIPPADVRSSVAKVLESTEVALFGDAVRAADAQLQGVRKRR